jgi:hypothetical protein
MPTLSTYPVLTIMPDFAAPPRLRAMRAFDSVKMSVAPEVRFIRGAHAQHTFYFEFLLHGRENIRELTDFFYDQRGKWGEFFVLSWHPELKPAASILDTETELSIEPIAYDELFAADESETLQVIENLGHHIFLLHDEGDLHLTRVNSVSGADPEVLELVTAVARDFDLDRFIVGWLYLVRFLNDELELEFNGPESAKCSLAMTELVFTDPTELFDPNPCAVVDITNGGGNTFDCYADGDYSNGGFPVAGTGLINYVAATGPFLVPFGDEFDDYPDGSYSGGVGASVTGFTNIFAA